MARINPDPYDRHYDEEFEPGTATERLRDSEDKAGNFSSNDNSDIESLESQGVSHINKFTGGPRALSGGGILKRSLGRAKGFMLDRKKGPATAIIVITLGGLLAGGFFFGSLLGPIAAIQNITLDLDDTTYAVQQTVNNLLAKKILKSPISSGSDALSVGCRGVTGKLPIKCRFALASPQLEAKLNSVGLSISGDKIGGFTRPNTITDTRSGRVYTPAEFERAVLSDMDLNMRWTNAYRSNYFSRMGPTWVRGVLSKFNVRHTAPDLSGTPEERSKQLKSGSVDTRNPRSVTLVEWGEDPDTGDKLYVEERELSLTNEDGSPKDPSRVYTSDEKVTIDAMSNDLRRPQRTKGLISRVSPGMVHRVTSSINWFGAVDQACTVVDMIGAASVAAKVANAIQLAVYAMNIAPLVGKLHAGDGISPEDAEALQKWYNDTDARERIAGYVDLPNGEVEMREVDNPDYGKSASDSDLFHMSAGLGVAAASMTNTSYSLGLGQNSLLKSVQGIAGLGDKIINLGSDDAACKRAQDWRVRAGGLIISIGVAVLGIPKTAAGSAVVTVSKGIAQFIAFTAAMMWAEDRIAAALSFDLIDEDIESIPLERAAAFWTGMATLHSEHAQRRGMMPGNTEQIIAYQHKQNIARQNIIAQERRNSHPLDLRNPYSVAGSVALAIHKNIPASASLSSVASVPGGVVSLVSSGFGSVVNPYSAHAQSVDTARFSQCDDAIYAKINIDADVQCNVRFVMPPESMGWDPIELAEEMEKEKYVEDNTTTGYPEGYTPPNPNEEKNMAMDFLDGVVNDFYRTRTYGKNENAKKYGKFLDFCVFRALPFGETYEDTGAYGSAEKEWVTGENCMKTDNREINMFRAYVFTMSVNDDLDEAPIISRGGGGGGARLSESQLRTLIKEYGLPDPRADISPELTVYGSAVQGYDDLFKHLTDNPKASWATEEMLAAEKNFMDKGGELKEYLNSAWVWFETSQDGWPDPYQINCADLAEPTRWLITAHCSPSVGSGLMQVGGFQMWDREGDVVDEYKRFYSEDELLSVLQGVLTNSTNAMKDHWSYSAQSNTGLVGTYLGLVSSGSVSLDDIAPNGGSVKTDSKTQFLTTMLAKDPNIATALNSYAVSDSDLINGLKTQQCTYRYICAAHKQLLSNMVYALWLFDSQFGGDQNSDTVRGGGAGVSAIWGGSSDRKIIGDFKATVGPYYKHAVTFKLSESTSTHTGIDISGKEGDPVFSPVEGTIVCAGYHDRPVYLINSGFKSGTTADPAPIGCGAANDYSAGGGYGCTHRGDPPKYGAGTIAIAIKGTQDVLVLGHMAESKVTLGQTVRPGDMVGTVGCMNSWHTHVEYYTTGGDGPGGYRLVDPVEYLR